VTTSSWVGKSKPGCDLGPTLSFKDVHHPRWGGGQAEPALYLPCGPAGHPLPRRSGVEALAGPAGGADLDNVGLAGVVTSSVSESSVGLPAAPPARGRLPHRVHGRTTHDTTRC
jgi:hypothetical protein